MYVAERSRGIVNHSTPGTLESSNPIQTRDVRFVGTQDEKEWGM